MRRMTSAGVTPSLWQAATRCASRIRKSAERDSRAQQRAGEEAALEIPPRVQHVLRAHARLPSGSLRVAGVHGAVRRDDAVAVVQNLVADEERQLVLQPLFLIAQALVDEHRAGRLESRAHQGAARLAAVAVEPANLATHGACTCRARASRVSGICRLPPSSAARSMSGKLLWWVSCQTRISSCANWRPVVPVCDNSSGSAFCSSSCENRNAGSSGMASRPPRSRCCGAASTAVFSSRNQRGVLAEDAGQHRRAVAADGMRLPVSTMLR